MLAPEQLNVSNLGSRRFRSPLNLSTRPGDDLGDFTPDNARLLYRADFVAGEDIRTDLSFEKAGPREQIYFDPARTVAAIVTCGGLCPGLNNVIRSVFLQLHHNYGVSSVLGIRYGYCGLSPAHGIPPARLTPESVESIHKLGGTVLGSSRGPEEPRVIVDFLESQGVSLLFTVGGDGTQRGAHAIAGEAQRRGLPLAVVGIPTVTTYHSSMARGHFELEPTITVFTSQVVNRVGQEKLAAYADPSGATSIRAAIEADKTLGGKVSDAHVIGFRPLDLEEYSAFGYFGGIFTMYVITRGDS